MLLIKVFNAEKRYVYITRSHVFNPKESCYYHLLCDCFFSLEPSQSLTSYHLPPIRARTTPILTNSRYFHST